MVRCWERAGARVSASRAALRTALLVPASAVAAALLVGLLAAAPATRRSPTPGSPAPRRGAAARRHLRTTCVVEALVTSMGVLLMTAAMTSGGF